MKHLTSLCLALLLLTLPVSAKSVSRAQVMQFLDQAKQTIADAMFSESDADKQKGWQQTLRLIEQDPNLALGAVYVLEEHLKGQEKPDGPALVIINVLARCLAVKYGSSDGLELVQKNGWLVQEDFWKDTPLAAGAGANNDQEWATCSALVDIGAYNAAADRLLDIPNASGVVVATMAVGLRQALGRFGAAQALTGLQKQLEGPPDGLQVALQLAIARDYHLAGERQKALAGYTRAAELAVGVDGEDAMLSRFVAHTWKFALALPDAPTPASVAQGFDQAFGELEKIPLETRFNIGLGSRALPAGRFWFHLPQHLARRHPAQKQQYLALLPPMLARIKALEERGLTSNLEFIYAFTQLELEAAQMARESGDDAMAKALLKLSQETVENIEPVVHKATEELKENPSELYVLKAQLERERAWQNPSEARTIMASASELAAKSERGRLMCDILADELRLAVAAKALLVVETRALKLKEVADQIKYEQGQALALYYLSLAQKESGQGAFQATLEQSRGLARKALEAARDPYEEEHMKSLFQPLLSQN